MSAVMPIVSSIGTPALISWPIVCRQRLMYRARNSFLNSGTVSLTLSNQRRPQSVLQDHDEAPDAASRPRRAGRTSSSP